jgi:hypothetical protein
MLRYSLSTLLSECLMILRVTRGHYIQKFLSTVAKGKKTEWKILFFILRMRITTVSIDLVFVVKEKK